MKPLKIYQLPVTLYVKGESPTDALDYVQTALEHSDLLDQDGIVGFDPEIDEDDIELQEEE
jgi:hypothetical protein